MVSQHVFFLCSLSPASFSLIYPNSLCYLSTLCSLLSSLSLSLSLSLSRSPLSFTLSLLSLDQIEKLPVAVTDVSKLVTVLHVISASAVVGGALSFFMEITMARKKAWWDESKRTQRVTKKYDQWVATKVFIYFIG